MKLYPFVVFANRMRGFDTLEDAKVFALTQVPCVICERQPAPEGLPLLVEIMRHDLLYDDVRKEWRIMLA